MDGAAAMIAVEESDARNKQQNLMCPRCQSTNTKFCYFNNYNMSQPRHFCKTCRRYWTRGGSLRNIPVGGGSRKKRPLLGPPGGNAGGPVVVVGNNNNNNKELGGENRVAKRVMMNSHLTARSGGVALMMVSSSTAPTPASILGRVGFDAMGNGARRFGHLLEGNRDCGNILCPTAGVGQMQIAPTISSDNSGGNNNSFLDSSSVPTYHFPPHDDFTFWNTGGGIGSNATTTGTDGGGGGWADVPPRF